MRTIGQYYTHHLRAGLVDYDATTIPAGYDQGRDHGSPEAFERGLAAVRRHGETVDPVPVVEPIDFFAFTAPPLTTAPPPR